jgi:hypothetical protein
LGADQKTVCFDLDGTLCTNTFGDYEDAEPFGWAIERVNDLARAGHRIVVFTARGTATGIDWDAVTRAQLERWGVAYDELRFGKPSADVYVDDRAVHTTAWREADAFAIPGFAGHVPGPEELPLVPPPQRTSVSETGRTFGGDPFLLEAHVERLSALAAASGIRRAPSREDLAGATRAALDATQAGGELTFTISISDVVSAAFVDTWEPVLPPTAQVSCRRLGQAAAGLRRFLVPGRGPLIAAGTDATQEAWPLELTGDGSLRDTLGGRVGVVVGRELALDPDSSPPSALSQWLAEHAEKARLELSQRPLSPADLHAAEEALIIGLPFGVVALGALDGETLAGAGPGTRALQEAWSGAVGVDLNAELGELLGVEDGG